MTVRIAKRLRYPEELPALAELLPRIATPVTIVNGRSDRVVPVANAEFLAERLPKASVVSIAHRPAVERYHTRRWTLVPHRDGPAVLRAA